MTSLLLLAGRIINVVDKPMQVNVVDKPMQVNVVDKPMQVNVVDKPMQVNCWHFIIYEQDQFRAQLS